MRGSRQTRRTLVLLLLIAFTLTGVDYNSAQRGPLASLRRGIDTVFGPLQRTVGGAADTVGSALGGLPRLGSYQSQNKKLKRDNDRLQGILRNQAATQCRYDQFLALSAFVQYTKYPVVPARVVSVGAASAFEWTAVIDAGTLDGVRPDLTVVTGQGLVGRITEVSTRTSTVLLIADPGFTVGGTLVGQTAVGFASGNGAGPMTLSLARPKSPVKKGTELLTSGDGTYAAGIPIGSVTSVTPNSNALSSTIRIAPFVDVRTLDLVGVITLPTRTAPRTPLQPVRPSASSACPAAVPDGPVPTARPTPTTKPAAPPATPSGTPTP